MKFSELAKIDVGPHEFEDFTDVLRKNGVEAPKLVVRQFYFDHRSNPEFIEQYGHLELGNMLWALESRSAEKILGASIYSQFERWVETCAARFDSEADYRVAILHPAEVQDHWIQYGTWTVAPIFLAPLILGCFQPNTHLVEGHTRIGCLRGAVRNGLISDLTHHEIWLGRSKQ